MPEWNTYLLFYKIWVDHFQNKNATGKTKKQNRKQLHLQTIFIAHISFIFIYFSWLTFWTTSALVTLVPSSVKLRHHEFCDCLHYFHDNKELMPQFRLEDIVFFAFRSDKHMTGKYILSITTTIWRYDCFMLLPWATTRWRDISLKCSLKRKNSICCILHEWIRQWQCHSSLQISR